MYYTLSVHYTEHGVYLDTASVNPNFNSIYLSFSKVILVMYKSSPVIPFI